MTHKKRQLSDVIRDQPGFVSVFRIEECVLTERITETVNGDFRIKYDVEYVHAGYDDVMPAGLAAVDAVYKKWAHLKRKKITLVFFEYGHYIDENGESRVYEYPLLIPAISKLQRAHNGK